MSKWFLYQNDEVTGPLSAQQLSERIEESADKATVWGLGKSEWLPAQQWLQQIQKQKLQGHPIEDEQDAQAKWYYSLPEENKKFGPLSFYDLRDELEQVPDLNKVFIWTKQMTDWQAFYQCSELLKKMNIRQQQVPRIHINGQIEITTDQNTFKASAYDLSLTGLGAEQCEGELQLNQRVKLNIKSPEFEEDLQVEAVVRHTVEGRAGFEFENLSSLNQNHIMNCFKARNQQAAQEPADQAPQSQEAQQEEPTLVEQQEAEASDETQVDNEPLAA